jgi:DNA-binding NtrC family response regulator
MEAVRRMIRRVAPAEATVFVTGEPGTGKQQVARAIHQASPRAALPFVEVDCGGVTESMLDRLLFGGPAGNPGAVRESPQGLLGSSQIGTVFLAHLDLAPASIQRKLHSTIEDRQFTLLEIPRPVPLEVRLIAAASSGRPDMNPRGQILPALQARLALMQITIPPLRERIQDLPELVRHLLSRLSATLRRPLPTMDPAAERVLLGHSWPGNVRELRNVLERTMILLEGSLIREGDLPDQLLPILERSENMRAAREEFEIQHVKWVLMRHGGNIHQAAKALGMNVSSVYRKLRRSRAR